MNKKKREKTVTIAFVLSVTFLLTSLISKQLGTADFRTSSLLFVTGTFFFGLALFKWIE